MDVDRHTGKEEKSFSSLSLENGPLIFQPNRWVVMTCWLVFGGLSILGLALMFESILNFKNEPISWFYICSGGFCFILFSVLLVDCYKTKLIITEEHFLSYGLLRGTRQILIKDIIGFRYNPNWGYFLEGNACSNVRPVQVYNYHKNIEPVLKFILQSYTDLDEKEAQENQEVVYRSGVLGNSELEVRSNKKRLKGVVRFMQGLSILCVLGFFFEFHDIPVNLQLILFFLGVLLPILALALAIYFRGAVCLSSVQQSKTVPDVALIALLPMLSIYFTTLDVNLVDVSEVFPYCIIISTILFLMAIKAQYFTKNIQKYLNAICLAGFGLFYGYSIITYANKVFDSSSPKKVTTNVINKSTSNGKKKLYSIELEAYGPIKEQPRIEMSKRSYDSLSIGDKASLQLYDGYFGFSWYYLKEIKFFRE